MRGRALVPNRWQSLAEVIYGFVRSMVTDVMGEEGKRFFPYIFTLFIFLLFLNMLALLPGSFTVTSHIAVTGVLALGVFFTVIVLGFVRNGTAFLKMFWIEVRAAGAAPDPGHHRADLVLRPAGQPLGPTCRQHDGGPRGAEGFRRLRPGARRLLRAARDPAAGR